jgi:hypothetical protein
LVLLVGVLATLSTLGCVCGGLRLPLGVVRGSGNVDVEQRSISGVTEVDLASFGYLHIEIGEQESVRIEAEDNLLRYIETEVDGNMLTIRHRRGTALRPTEPIDYYLTVRELAAVRVSGAGSVDGPEVKTGHFSVHISGAGSVDLEGLEADELDVRISGAGNLEVADGKVAEQQITISGAGDYRAEDLDSLEARVSLSGLGSAFVRVRDHLDVTISGAGSVKYVGSPTVEKQVTGVGRVERIGE